MRQMRKIKFVMNFFAISVLSMLCVKAKAQATFNLDNTISGIKFYHQIVQCNGNNVVFLKFENTTTQNVTITFIQVFDTQIEKGVASFKGSKKLLLLPGIIMQEGCDDKVHPDFVLTASDVTPAYLAKILAFSFSNITVVTAQ